ncbi:hypothetical protein R1sor_007482 [Riccia sorocarpa]|uniref:Uncharacterized protein n=1 Tax=Riccia sorocarpa TaxID=122646 RepID=A0ABD3HSR6_9MARC
MDVLDSQVVVPKILEAATVEVLIEDIPIVAVQAPLTSAVAEVTMDENLVDVGGASKPTYDHEMGKGEIIHEVVPTIPEAATVEELIQDIPVTAVEASSTSGVADVAMGENLVDVEGASEPAYDHELEKGQIIPEVVPTTSEAATIKVLIVDIPVAAVQARPTSVVAEATMGEILVEHGESMWEYFPLYNDKQRTAAKINFTTYCNDLFLNDNWENWFKIAIGGRKDGTRTKVRKNFLFFADLEKHGLNVDWTTVDKSKNVLEISAAERHAARVELWRRKTVLGAVCCILKNPNSDMMSGSKENLEQRRPSRLVLLRRKIY